MSTLEEIEQEGSDDSSDEDFNPEGCGNASASEEESDGAASEGEDGGNSGEENGKKRRKGGSRGPRKKRRNGTVPIQEEKEEEKENSEKVDVLTEEERKKKSDSLWADFLRDCGPPAKKNPSTKHDSPESQDSSVPKSQKSPALPESKPTPEPKKITQVLTFAGEEVKVEKPVTEVLGKPGRRSGGLGSLLSQLGKGGKLSTLEKSKLDWESFKVKEGIKEDLETHNKGKSGYLERQDFLTRTDQRQFELEKQLRNQRRSLNR